ncbi:MAG: hypothetical protein ABGY09_08185 [Euryarchaeota archaeon]
MIAHRGSIEVEVDGKPVGECEGSLRISGEDVFVVPRGSISVGEDPVLESVGSSFSSAELESGSFTPPRSRVVLTPPTAAALVAHGITVKRFEVEGSLVLTTLGGPSLYPFERRILVPEGELTLRFVPKNPEAVRGSLLSAANRVLDRSVASLARGRAVRICRMRVTAGGERGSGTLRVVPREDTFLLLLQPEEDELKEVLREAVDRPQLGMALTAPEAASLASGDAVLRHGKGELTLTLDVREYPELRAEGEGLRLRAVPSSIPAAIAGQELLRRAAEAFVREVVGEE